MQCFCSVGLAFSQRKDCEPPKSSSKSPYLHPTIATDRHLHIGEVVCLICWNMMTSIEDPLTLYSRFQEFACASPPGVGQGAGTFLRPTAQRHNLTDLVVTFQPAFRDWWLHWNHTIKATKLAPLSFCLLNVRGRIPGSRGGGWYCSHDTFCYSRALFNCIALHKRIRYALLHTNTTHWQWLQQKERSVP